MNPEAREEFISTVIDTRFDPGVGDRSSLWRAWTGHQHAMIALALTLAFLGAIRHLELKSGLLSKLGSLGVLVGAPIMSIASFSVWAFGKTAHLVITPAAVILITGTLILSFAAKAGNPLSPRGSLAWGLRLGSIGIWAFVAAPGAIFAMSLEEPTIFFNPPVRSPEWDWVELAFNIGHWHVLLLAWGAALALTAIYLTWGGLLSGLAAWAVIVGFIGSGLGATLYIFTAKPEPYNPNPYDNEWLKLLVEPSLTAIALGVIILYFKAVRSLIARGKERQASP
jgi:hypothetical protein